MLVCDTYHGNVEDAEPEGEVERVVLSRADARRSRVRAETEEGSDVGIVVDRRLRDGDIVYDGETAVVVTLEAVEAFAVGIDALTPTEAAEFGHELGNAHGEMAVDDEGVVYVPVEDARTLVNRLGDDVSVERVEVEPSVFDGDDAEHGGHGGHAEAGHDHSHDHSREHEHEHDHAEEHGHTNDHGHSHHED